MRARVVSEARRWLGTPYRHQASAWGAGCDCLGLVRGIWRALYGADPAPLPPYAADWRRNDVRDALEVAAERYFAPARGPKAGQLVLFKLVRKYPARHCGIMVADDRFIHAQEQIGVAEAHLGEAWTRRVAGCFDFPDITGEPIQSNRMGGKSHSPRGSVFSVQIAGLSPVTLNEAGH